MEIKREEAENPSKEVSNLNPQLLHEDGDLKVFGNKADDTAIYQISDYTTSKKYALKMAQEGYIVEVV